MEMGTLFTMEVDHFLLWKWAKMGCENQIVTNPLIRNNKKYKLKYRIYGCRSRDFFEFYRGIGAPRPAGEPTSGRVVQANITKGKRRIPDGVVGRIWSFSPCVKIFYFCAFLRKIIGRGAPERQGGRPLLPTSGPPGWVFWMGSETMIRKTHSIFQERWGTESET